MFEVPRNPPVESGVRVSGAAEWSRLLNRVLAVLTGRGEPNHFRQIIATDFMGRGFFVNDNCWWIYTDAQCNAVSTFGWRPWFPADLRAVDTRTWRMFLPLQSDGRAEEGTRVVPAGALPFNHNPGTRANPHVSRSFYSNYFWNDPSTWHPDHDELLDFQLLHLITIADSLLWQQKRDLAREVWPSIERFLAYVRNRPHREGLLWVGVQGSQIEFSHGTPRYTLTTQWYWQRVLELVAEVAQWLGDKNAAKRCRAEAAIVREAIRSFRMPGGWYAAGRTEDWSSWLGDGTLAGKSGYFETHANAAPALFGLLPDDHAPAIAERIYAIPQMWENHIGVYNYPARPPEEIDDAARFPGPGVHVNGGWWWLAAGESLALFARAGHAQLGPLAAALLEDHDARFTIDYYNRFGAGKAEQWRDKWRPDQCGVTELGAWGNLFRSLWGLQIGAETLGVRPRLPQGVDALALSEPVYVGEARLLLSAERGASDGAALDGRDVPWDAVRGALVPVSRIRDGGRLVVSVAG